MNTSAANVTLQFPDGSTKVVNMLRLLVQAQNAEFKRDHGMFLPSVGKLHPTVKAIREEYRLPKTYCRTWAQAAEYLRALHTDITEQLGAER